MVDTYCGLNTDCVSTGGTFDCVCKQGYENFVPHVGCIADLGNKGLGEENEAKKKTNSNILKIIQIFK